MFIDGKEVTKDRTIYEPLIQPTTNIIENIGTGSTVIYVEKAQNFLDNEQENSTKQDKVTIISQDSKIAAAATATVSGLGTISSINITNAGLGYNEVPSVTIANPVGLELLKEHRQMQLFSSWYSYYNNCYFTWNRLYFYKPTSRNRRTKTNN